MSLLLYSYTPLSPSLCYSFITQHPFVKLRPRPSLLHDNLLRTTSFLSLLDEYRANQPTLAIDATRDRTRCPHIPPHTDPLGTRRVTYCTGIPHVSIANATNTPPSLPSALLCFDGLAIEVPPKYLNGRLLFLKKKKYKQPSRWAGQNATRHWRI